MFLENLYTKLGVPPEAKIRIRISHDGLSGRILTSASSRRYIHERETQENNSTTEIVTILGTMKQTRVDDVRKILEPTFMIFDFAEFASSVYDDIVRAFERGEVR